MPKVLNNTGASVRARLLNLAKQQNRPFDLLLTRFVLERFLYRLSLTPHRDRLVLKGAMLIATWFTQPHRETRDIDIFREIGAIEIDDGVWFDSTAFEAEPIREEQRYGGFRVTTTATVGGARVRIVIDVACGDAIEPGIEEMDLPVLLDYPAPSLRAYARETVIAEKFHAMVILGRINSRMKDYYDIWLLSHTYDFIPTTSPATDLHGQSRRPLRGDTRKSRSSCRTLWPRPLRRTRPKFFNGKPSLGIFRSKGLPWQR